MLLTYLEMPKNRRKVIFWNFITSHLRKNLFYEENKNEKTMIPFIYYVSVIYNQFINDHAAAFTVV